METFVTILHFAICIFLIVVILLQAGKGADIGAAFGAGGSQTLFGPTGAATFLNKMTAVVAVIFLATSLALVSLSEGKRGRSILEKVPAAAGTAEPAPAQPPLTTPETQR